MIVENRVSINNLMALAIIYSAFATVVGILNAAQCAFNFNGRRGFFCFGVAHF